MGNVVSTQLVKKMVGGVWPEASGFSFDSVDHFEIENDEEHGGMLVPYDGSSPAPGPSFALKMLPCSLQSSLL